MLPLSSLFLFSEELGSFACSKLKVKVLSNPETQAQLRVFLHCTFKGNCNMQVQALPAVLFFDFYFDLLILNFLRKSRTRVLNG